MLVPSTYQIALLLAVIASICLGSWANTQKMTGNKHRFEIFYLDFTLGAFLFAIAICFTLGSVNQAEITFTDSLIGIAFRKVSIAILAGVLFNLANAFFISVVSISGMSLAFPLVVGLGALITLIGNYFLNPQGNVTMMIAGALFLIGAMVVTARAYRMAAQTRRAMEAAQAAASSDQPPVQVPRGAPTRRPRKTGKTKSIATKGVVLSLLAGFFLGPVSILIDMSREGDMGIPGYVVIMFFAVGMLFTSLLVSPFWMNFPIEGEPLGISAYFKKANVRTHLLGFVGGVIAMAGFAAMTLAGAVPANQQIGTVISLALTMGIMALGTAWGVVVWGEFAGTGSRVRTLVMLMFVLIFSAAALISLAPNY
ncbi:multidrug DMT transporter permease [Bryobacterales bacterium F-183]|nr:multidrug DMT transporter permease [Bryobacterales bacterium F-183]